MDSSRSENLSGLSWSMGLDRDSPVDFTYLAAPISAYWSNLVGLIMGPKRFRYLLPMIILEMGKPNLSENQRDKVEKVEDTIKIGVLLQRDVGVCLFHDRRLIEEESSEADCVLLLFETLGVVLEKDTLPMNPAPSPL